MVELAFNEDRIVEKAQNRFFNWLSQNNISIDQRDDFDQYTAIRHRHGDRHLNQAFDPRQVKFGSDDFWLLAANHRGEAIATYCLRRLLVDDFFDLIRSLALWFAKPLKDLDRRFLVQCQMPPFGGEVVHGGGLWVRDDHRGFLRLAVVMPHLARALALHHRGFDHDCAMIRNNPGDGAQLAERRAIFMGRKVYGFARVHRFVDGWFPPEGRNAIMHLCHSTRAESLVSLSAVEPAGKRLRLGGELGNRPLVNQHDEPVHTTAILSQRQQQPGI